MTFILIFGIFMCFLPMSVPIDLIYEANHSRVSGNHETENHNNTIGVVVTPKKSYFVNFCTRVRSIVRISNIRFRSEGKAVSFSVSFDHGLLLGTYFSLLKKEHNELSNTGKFQKEYELEAGWHVMKIKLFDNSSRVVLHFVTFDFDDNKMTNDILLCKISCIPSASFPPKRQDTLDVVPATIQQLSEPTNCSEVDNVNIPIFHPDIHSYLITASLPQYKSFANKRDHDLSNCPHLSPEVWRFNNFHIKESPTQISSQNAYLITNPGQFDTKSKTLLVVIFRMEGQRHGSINSKIGSEIYIRFQNLAEDVNVRLKYKGKANFVNSGRKKFNEDQLEHMWTVPDFTWSEDFNNYIAISTDRQSDFNFTVDNVRLVKRPMKPEKITTIYRSSDVIIEASFIEMWWLAPEYMSVKMKNGETTNGVAYIRFYRPVPWTSGYAQVFVLYHDGNMRILPVAPPGLDWIPFGTSVILGQTYMTDTERPYLYITQIELDPEKWHIKLFYKDGGSANLQINGTYSETQVLVSDVICSRSTILNPFATVRSMYNEEGNTDVDSIKVDDKHWHDVMDKWGVLMGKSFSFCRRCISDHLTLSPDIQIDILETRSRGHKKSSYIQVDSTKDSFRSLMQKYRNLSTENYIFNIVSKKLGGLV